jgi:rfaE bifunctional protein kinase chain/domain
MDRRNLPSQAEQSVESAVNAVRELAGLSARVGFVSGNFNIVHPGHLRLLNFAKDCCDFLVVGVCADRLNVTLLPEQLRLESVRSIGLVDYAVILPGEPWEFIAALRPAFVVKGKEHETHPNPEAAIVEQYGGNLLFSSGDVRFSSLDLLQRELLETNFSTIRKPQDFPQRHGFALSDLADIVPRFKNLKVAVVGDLIVDEYISCDPLGMSQEDPTIVVTPIRTDRFVGGAGIVAAHAAGLGAQVQYFTITGQDEPANFAESTLSRYRVSSVFLHDRSRPTTLKQRYRARDKTLLRVSHLRQHDAGHDLVDSLFEQMRPALDAADVLLFADFNYGCLPQDLVDRVSQYGRERGMLMVADSQASSQIGDVSRFQHMELLTPTEREARLAMRDSSAGLVVLAENLRVKAHARHVLMTLGAEGLLIHAHDREHDCRVTDRLPAFNTAPKDVSGAGDSLLTCAAMALAVGADVWQAAYLGSVAAGCQVGRVGNTPLSAEELLYELSL